MSTTNILGIDEVAENQNSKHITINDAFAVLEQAANSRVEVDMGDADYEMTELQFTTAVNFYVSNITASRLLTVPDAVNTVAADRTIIISNPTAYDITVEAGATPANTLTIASNSSTLLHVGGSTLTPLFFKSATVATGDEVSMGIFIPGQPGTGAEMLRHVFARAVDFAADFTSSRGSVGTNPTSAASLGMSKNGTPFGTIAITTGGVFTYNTSTTPISFVAGDILTITAPSPQDATLADIGLTLWGTKA